MAETNGSFMTVLGPVPASQIEITLCHEHLLNNTMTWFRAPDESAEVGALEPVSYENGDWLRRFPYGNRANLLHADLQVIETELRRYKLAGGSAVVDASSRGLGRDVWALKTLAERVGIHVVAGSGYYVAPTHPWDMDEKSVDAITAEIIDDITIGVDGTTIRAGLIGEIGTSDPVTDNEWKVVRAAAQAQRQTGAVIQIHALHETRTAPRILDLIINQESVDPTRVIQCHMDLVLDDWPYTESIAQTGAYVEYDCFGHLCPTEGVWVTDEERIDGLIRLLEHGYDDQILLSQDVGLTARLSRYGGPGWTHLLHVICPKLIEHGISPLVLQKLMVDNPRAAFALAAPVTANTQLAAN